MAVAAVLMDPKLNKLKEQITKISMEGELVVVEPCGFPVVVEDDPEERTFLESAQSVRYSLQGH